MTNHKGESLKIFIQDNDGEFLEIGELENIEKFEFHKTPPREKVIEAIRSAIEGLEG